MGAPVGRAGIGEVSEAAQAVGLRRGMGLGETLARCPEHWELVSQSGRDIVVLRDLLGGGWSATNEPAGHGYIERHCHGRHDPTVRDRRYIWRG